MKGWISLIFLFSLVSCGGVQLPVLQDGNGAGTTLDRCRELFAVGDFQMVHGIEFSTGSGGATVIGVTVRHGDSLQCGLMGVEGFVLFEAVQDEGLEVKRALPPFDNPSFAQGLMRDVQTLFLLPPGIAVSGKTSTGEQVCRYTAADGVVTDVSIPTDNSAHIDVYDSEKKRVKSVSLFSFVETELGTLPERMELTVSGSRGYSLKMKLISAEKI